MGARGGVESEVERGHANKCQPATRIVEPVIRFAVRSWCRVLIHEDQRRTIATGIN